MLPSLSNQAVLVSNAYAGSTPLYAALSFLQSHQDRTVIIYTPIKSVYPKSSQDPIDIEEGLDWRLAEDDATSSIDTKLKADEWFLHNGLRGSTAALLARIQIIHVDSLAQLAICLAVYPSAQLNQEATGNVMLILHDITLLPNHPSDDSTRSFSEARSYAPFSSDIGREEEGTRIATYLMIIIHALGAKMMAGQDSKLVLFECRFDATTRSILRQYLVEESLQTVVPDSNHTA